MSNETTAAAKYKSVRGFTFWRLVLPDIRLLYHFAYSRQGVWDAAYAHYCDQSQAEPAEFPPMTREKFIAMCRRRGDRIVPAYLAVSLADLKKKGGGAS